MSDSENKRILIIDDEPNVTEMLKDNLEYKGYEVIIANGGREGLEKAIEYKPDIITLDLKMPDMDGFKVLQALKSDTRTKDITVFIISVLDEEDSTKQGFLLGARIYMVKPFSMTTLEDLIEDIFQDNAIYQTVFH